MNTFSSPFSENSLETDISLSGKVEKALVFIEKEFDQYLGI